MVRKHDYHYQDQNTLIVDDGEIGYGDVTVK